MTENHPQRQVQERFREYIRRNGRKLKEALIISKFNIAKIDVAIGGAAWE